MKLWITSKYCGETKGFISMITFCPQAGLALPCPRQAGFSNPCPRQAGMKRKQIPIVIGTCQNEPSAGRFDAPRTRFEVGLLKLETSHCSSSSKHGCCSA